MYLTDMLAYARRVRERVGERTREELWQDDKAREAVGFNLMVLGEAAAQISEPTRLAHPEIPWARIVGMRNRLIDGYERIDFDKV